MPQNYGLFVWARKSELQFQLIGHWLTGAPEITHVYTKKERPTEREDAKKRVEIKKLIIIIKRFLSPLVVCFDSRCVCFVPSANRVWYGDMFFLNICFFFSLKRNVFFLRSRVFCLFFAPNSICVVIISYNNHVFSESPSFSTFVYIFLLSFKFTHMVDGDFMRVALFALSMSFVCLST